MTVRFKLVILSSFAILWGVLEGAAAVKGIRPEDVYVADSRKTHRYVRDGLVVGGDQAVNDITIKNIRLAKGGRNYERLIIDIQGNRDGDPNRIFRPPYYQIAVKPIENQLVMTIWGRPKLEFSARSVKEKLKMLRHVRAAALFPILEEDRWTFVIEARKAREIEVFELSDPVRIVVDIKK